MVGRILFTTPLVVSGDYDLQLIAEVGCKPLTTVPDAFYPFSILDKGNVEFREFLLTLDHVTSNLHRQGVGVKKRSAEVIAFHHEDRFWANKLFGYCDPKTLQRTVFCMCVLVCVC